MNVPEAIRRRRLRAKMTLRELSERVGVSIVHACNYEQGRKTPSLARFVQLAEAFGIAPSLLMREAEVIKE